MNISLVEVQPGDFARLFKTNISRRTSCALRWRRHAPTRLSFELSRQCCRSNFQGYTHPRHCTHEPISRSAQRIKRLWCGRFRRRSQARRESSQFPRLRHPGWHCLTVAFLAARPQTAGIDEAATVRPLIGRRFSKDPRLPVPRYSGWQGECRNTNARCREGFAVTIPGGYRSPFMWRDLAPLFI